MGVHFIPKGHGGKSWLPKCLTVRSTNVDLFKWPCLYFAINTLPIADMSQPKTLWLKKMEICCWLMDGCMQSKYAITSNINIHTDGNFPHSYLKIINHCLTVNYFELVESRSKLKTKKLLEGPLDERIFFKFRYSVLILKTYISIAVTLKINKLIN